MRIFYSKYLGLSFGWGRCERGSSTEHKWRCRNHLSIRFTTNDMWKIFRWKCFTSWQIFKWFIDDLFLLPYVHSYNGENQIACETYYYWLLFVVFVDIESLENVKAKWVHD